MQTHISFRRLLGPMAAIALLSSCGGPKSSSTSGPNGGAVPTHRITLRLTATSEDGRTVVVRANLNDGHIAGASYRLDGGDFLRACLGTVCKSMADNDSVLEPDYIARFDFQSGVDFVVSFNRQEARDAPDSRARLPPAFDIVAPANHQPVTDGDVVMVTWAPNGAPARASVGYEADCRDAGGSKIFSSGALSTDTNSDGRESFRVDEILTEARRVTTLGISRCSIDVIVRHELEGRVDAAFDDGTAMGTTMRRVTLDYLPR